MLSVVVDPNGGFLKIGLAGPWNFHKFLGVEVHDGEPTALHLHHYAVTFGKKMGYFIEIERHLLGLARNKRFRRLIAIAEFTPKHLSPYHSLKTGHILY